MKLTLRNLRNFVKKHWIIILLAIFGIFYYTRNIEGLTDAQKKARVTAKKCVCEKYAANKKCNWGNWSEMYKTCELPAAGWDGDAQIKAVKAGDCSWAGCARPQMSLMGARGWFKKQKWVQSGCKGCRGVRRAGGPRGCAVRNHRCCERKLDECRRSHQKAQWQLGGGQLRPWTRGRPSARRGAIMTQTPLLAAAKTLHTGAARGAFRPPPWQDLLMWSGEACTACSELRGNRRHHGLWKKQCAKCSRMNARRRGVKKAPAKKAAFTNFY